MPVLAQAQNGACIVVSIIHPAFNILMGYCFDFTFSAQAILMIRHILYVYWSLSPGTYHTVEEGLLGPCQRKEDSRSMSLPLFKLLGFEILGIFPLWGSQKV